MPLENLGGLRSGIFWPASHLAKTPLLGLFYFLHTIKHIYKFDLALIVLVGIVWMLALKIA